MKSLTAISIEKSLLEEVDYRRGLIPRSAYISKIIDNFIKNQRGQISSPDLSLNTSMGIEDEKKR